MERTKKVLFKIKADPDREDPIERRVIIGVITNTEYIKKIRDRWDIKLLETPYAKKLAAWSIEYFDKYNAAIGKDIVHRFAEICSQKKVTKDEAEDIQGILDDLSKQYVEGANTQFLADQTITYFKRRQAELLIEQLEAAKDAGDLDTFNTLLSSFKPIPSTFSDDTQLNLWDIKNMEVKPIEWLIADFLPKGLTILGGKSKAGKSYFTLNLAVHLVKNSWIFADAANEGYKGKSGAVLYLSLEDSLRRISARIDAIDPEQHEKYQNFDVRFVWDKLNSGGLTAIEEWIEEKKREEKRPKLVVIDVLAKVWNKSTSTSGGNLYGEEYAIYGALADVAHKHDISIIAITHTVKEKMQDPFDQILGGSGMQGPADNLMVLESGKGDSEKILHIKGKDIEETHLVFEVSNNYATWVCRGPVGVVQKTDQRQSIYTYIRRHGPKTTNELKEAVKKGAIEVSINSLIVILQRMVKEGQLEHFGKNQPYAIAGTEASLIGEGLKKRN